MGEGGHRELGSYRSLGRHVVTHVVTYVEDYRYLNRHRKL